MIELLGVIYYLLNKEFGEFKYKINGYFLKINNTKKKLKIEKSLKENFPLIDFSGFHPSGNSYDSIIVRMELASFLFKKSQYKDAEAVVKDALKKINNYNEKEFKENLNEGFEDFTNTFKFYGGESNLGMIKRVNKETNDIFLTKINYNKGIYVYSNLREVNFYQNFYKEFSKIRKITPELQSMKYNKNKTTFSITVDLIYNNNKHIHLEKIDELSHKIHTSVPYSFNKKFNKMYPARRESSRPLLAHKRITHMFLLGKTNKKLNSLDNLKSIKYIQDDLERFMLLNKFYQNIIPSTFYGLCHGDFHRNNILSNDGSLKIIDWDFYGFGMREFDIATFLINSFDYNYTELEQFIDFYLKNSCEIKQKMLIYYLLTGIILKIEPDNFHNVVGNYLVPIYEKFNYLLKD